VKAAVVAIGILLLACIAGGIVSYRRTLGRGEYSGSFRGALGVGSILGVFLGGTLGLATLFIVLAVKAFR
jgi:hypothetical protein